MPPHTSEIFVFASWLNFAFTLMRTSGAPKPVGPVEASQAMRIDWMLPPLHKEEYQTKISTLSYVALIS